MPGGMELRDMRQLFDPQQVILLRENPELVDMITQPDGLLEVIKRQLPTLSAEELAWLENIPVALREAIRAVIVHVGSQETMDLQVDIQYEPAYAYSLDLYQFSDTIVVRMNGPALSP